MEEGEVVYWSVPDESLAFRFGAACWCRLRQRGDAAYLRRGNTSAEDTGPLPAVGATGPLVLVGRISREDVALICIAALQTSDALNKTFETSNSDEPGENDWASLFAKLEAD